MNIFVLDYNPNESARHMVDSHVMSKMIVESCQILSNCFTDEQLSHRLCPRTQKETARQHSYPHHPCCKWAQESKSNMMWIISNALSMGVERAARWSIVHPNTVCSNHFSMQFIHWCEKNINLSQVPKGYLTPFAQAMPDEYKSPDPVVAYRNYYKHGKKHLHKWIQNKPIWI